MSKLQTMAAAALFGYMCLLYVGGCMTVMYLGRVFGVRND